MRYIQQGTAPTKPKKETTPRDMPKAGGYKVSDLQAKGVKSGIWERKDD